MVINEFHKYEKCKKELLPLIKKGVYFTYPVKYQEFTQNSNIPNSCTVLDFHNILNNLDVKTELDTNEIFLKEYNTNTKITTGCKIVSYDEKKLENMVKYLNNQKI
jgi:hypothetical protein